MNVGNKMLCLIKHRGFNQKEFAAKLGIPYTTFNGYAKGIRQPDFELLKKICAELNGTMDYLFDTHTNSVENEKLCNLIKENDLDIDGLSRMLKVNGDIVYGWMAGQLPIDNKYQIQLEQIFELPDGYFDMPPQTNARSTSFPADLTQFAKDMSKFGITDEKLNQMTPEQKAAFYTTIRSLVENFSKNKK